jgi:hypothetical protein
MTAFTVLVLALAAQAPAPPPDAPPPDAPPPDAPSDAPTPDVPPPDAATTAVPETAAAKKIKLLVLDVKVANPDDIDAGAAETLTQFIAARAARFPIEVAAMADLRDLVELEGQKQAAGCDTSSSSCLSDLAGALGADLVLGTRAGKLDAVFVVSLQLYDARSTGSEGRASVEAWSLAEASTKAGPALDDLLRKATNSEPTETNIAPLAKKDAPPVAIDDTFRLGLQIGGGAAASVGAVLVVLGVVPALQYNAKKENLGALTRSFTGDDDDIAQATRLHREALEAKASYNNLGRWGVAGGTALVVLGGAALAAGFLLPSPTEGGAP